MKINLTKGFYSFRPMNLRIQGHSLLDYGEIKEFFSFPLVNWACQGSAKWVNDEGEEMEWALG